MEEEIQQALKMVRKDKSLRIDEVYLRLSHMFVPFLVTIYNKWMKQVTIPLHFIRGIVKLLGKDKHSGDSISNFRPLTMLNTDLKILVKILADCLQTILPSLIGPKQCCTMKGRTIQNSLHLVWWITEKVDGNAAPINLDQSKALIGLTMDFWRLSFLQPESSFSFADEFAFFMYTWSHSGSEQGKIKTLHFVWIDSSRLFALTHVVHPCAGAVYEQVESKPSTMWPHIAWQFWGCQEHCIYWRCQCACNERCQSGLRWTKKFKEITEANINYEKSVSLLLCS